MALHKNHGSGQGQEVVKDYYKTLAGLMAKQYAKQLKDIDHVFMPYNELWIHALYELRTYRDYWTTNRFTQYTERVYIVSSKEIHKPLSKHRVTLEAALRTADRIIDRGYDEWKRPLLQKKLPS